MSSFPALTLPYRTNRRTGDSTSLNTHAPLPSGYLSKLVPLSRLPSPHPRQPYWTLVCFSTPSQEAASSALSLCRFPVLDQRELWSFLLGSELSIRLRVLIPTRLWATEEAVSFQLCFPALRTRPSQGKASDKYLLVEWDRDPNSLMYQFLLRSQAHLRSIEKDSNAQSLNNTNILIINAISYFVES